MVNLCREEGGEGTQATSLQSWGVLSKMVLNGGVPLFSGIDHFAISLQTVRI